MGACLSCRSSGFIPDLLIWDWHFNRMPLWWCASQSLRSSLAGLVCCLLKPLSCSKHWDCLQISSVVRETASVLPAPSCDFQTCSPDCTWCSSNTIKVRVSVSGHLPSSWGHSTYPTPLPLKSQGSYVHSGLEKYASYTNDFFFLVLYSLVSFC